MSSVSSLRSDKFCSAANICSSFQALIEKNDEIRVSVISDKFICMIFEHSLFFNQQLKILFCDIAVIQAIAV